MMKTKESKMSDPMNELVDGVARAILKVRFYDPEPEMYDSLDSFWLELDEDHWLDGRQEAAAAIAAVQDHAAIVPSFVTTEMLLAAQRAAISRNGNDATLYEAMISASPYNPK
jgi:hypothetical protein